MSEKLSRRDFLKGAATLIAIGAGGKLVQALSGCVPTEQVVPPPPKVPESTKSPEKVSYSAVLSEEKVDEAFSQKVKDQMRLNPELANIPTQSFKVTSFSEQGSELTVEYEGYTFNGAPVLYFKGGDSEAHLLPFIGDLTTEIPTYKFQDEFNNVVFSYPAVVKEGEEIKVTYTPPTQLQPKLENWDGKSTTLTAAPDKNSFFYARKAESPALDPEAWNQYGNVLVKNGDISPYEKQLIVNPELQQQFPIDVMNLCNGISYLGALANEFNKSGLDAPPAPTGNLKDFETYKANVIQPAINNGEQIEGWHLVGHEKLASKQSNVGMTESLPKFDPSICALKLGGHKQIYAGVNFIDVGPYQVGMDTITTEDGRVVRRLLLNVDKTRQNQYGFFFANETTTLNENITAFSQMIYTANQHVKTLVNEIPNNNSTRDGFVWKISNKDRLGFSFAISGTLGVDLTAQYMNEAPAYFTAPTP